ncbi:MAG: Dephospho-CoA kinase [Chlamydiae bacterium]|nr:Dephospho-CoA kinase [Chlamydiota bacterium]
MLALKKIAVTGGLSSGKSTACHMLKELGAHVVSADEIVHRLLSPKTPIGQEVIKLLGGKIVDRGTIDRTQIAEEVFAHPHKLATLEKLLHPAVLAEIEQEFEREAAKDGNPLFIAEIPLLYESESEKQFDVVIAIVSEKQLARERFQNPKEFEKRMERQIDPHQKAARADYTLHNNGTLADLKKQILNLYQQLII